METFFQLVVLTISASGLATIPWRGGRWKMYTVHASFYLFLGSLAAFGLFDVM